jgi:hypothetical protein
MRTVLRKAAGLIVAVGLMFGVSATAGGVSADAATIPQTGSSFGVLSLSVHDNMTTVHAHFGELVVISLPATGNTAYDTYWHQPYISAGSSVVKLLSYGGYPSATTPSTGLFVALFPGTSTIWAPSDSPCFHQPNPCLFPPTLWQVTVIVG